MDATEDHEKWANDIEETQGHRAQLPDHRRRRLQRFQAVRDAAGRHVGRRKTRTPADNQTVRNVFVIGPDKKIKLILVYPMTTGRNFDEVLRVIDSLQLTAKHRVATPVNWKQGEDVIIAGSVSNDEAKQIFRTTGRSPSPTSASFPRPSGPGGLPGPADREATRAAPDLPEDRTQPTSTTNPAVTAEVTSATRSGPQAVRSSGRRSLPSH